MSGELARLTREEILGGNEFRDHDIPVEGKAWRVHARDIAYAEVLKLRRKNTRTFPVGRGGETREELNDEAFHRDLMLRMLDGSRCDPILSNDDIGQLPTRFVLAFTRYFKLDPKSLEERETKLGESEAS